MVLPRDPPLQTRWISCVTGRRAPLSAMLVQPCGGPPRSASGGNPHAARRVTPAGHRQASPSRVEHVGIVAAALTSDGSASSAQRPFLTCGKPSDPESVANRFPRRSGPSGGARGNTPKPAQRRPKLTLIDVNRAHARRPARERCSAGATRLRQSYVICDATWGEQRSGTPGGSRRLTSLTREQESHGWSACHTSATGTEHP